MGRVTERADKSLSLQTRGDTGPRCIIDEWSVAIDELLEKAELKYSVAVVKLPINYTCIMLIHHI